MSIGVNKSGAAMTENSPVTTLEAMVAEVPDGAKIAIATTRHGVAVRATHALIERRVKNLHLVAVPTSGLQADLLIGAGCVGTMESAGVTMDEHGQAPRFVAAVKAGNIKLKDTTCPALVSAVQAGEKGIPFIPMRGLIGSDLLANRPDYKTIDNPVAEGSDPIVLLPAITPDYAMFHAPLADRYGNVWIGKARELMTMAHAAKRTLITVEEIVDDNLMNDELTAPATIPAHYITACSKAEQGAWPLPLPGRYQADADELARYVSMAQTEDGFERYLQEHRDATSRTSGVAAAG
jgi:glutaconate CoA-transferase subunit A